MEGQSGIDTRIRRTWHWNFSRWKEMANDDDDDDVNDSNQT